MDKAKIIFPILMTAIMALVVTLVATLINIGWRSDFIAQWMKAYAVAWPVAAAVAYVAIPAARRATGWIIGRFE